MPSESPWLPPDYEPPPEIDPWECSAPDCTAIARYVKNGRPTCADHKEAETQ